MDTKTRIPNAKYPLPKTELPIPKILLVDDFLSIRSAMGRYLEGMGYRVATAESGKEAIDLMNKSTFDLVITDLVMGDIDGFQVLKVAKKLHSDTMVIILTGYSGVNFAIDGLRLGADDYLLKPCDPDEMQFRVVRCLEKLEIKRKIRRSEEALRESEKKFRTLFDTSPQAIALTEMKTGKLIDVNDNFFQLTKYTRDEVIGRTTTQLGFYSEDDGNRFVNELTNAGKISGLEMDFMAKDGSIINTRIFAVPIQIEREAFVLTEFHDVTEQKRLEIHLQQANKMEAIGALAGGIAHDYNNLLMAIQGRASIMIMDKDSSHPDFEHLREIEDFVGRAADLTKQLLGFARRGKNEVKTTDLNKLIKKHNQMFGGAKKEIPIHGEYEENLWPVEVDREQIVQVLLNLYVNSWQAMPEGGDLYVKTENIRLDENYVKPFGLAPGRYVNISVTDTGMGMDEATQQRIFDPFFSTKEMGRGTGLGLASVYGIIKNHGGIINIHSEKGEGTTFNVYLPASEAESIEQRAEGKKKDIIERGSEILLFVDDEEMIIDVGRQMLEQLGYEVLIAGSGKEAIDIYKENRGKIDMVILDMIMPEMGGGQTYDGIKEINPDVKVLLSSGYSVNGQAREILDRGCRGFIQKPYRMNELSQKLREILDEK